MIQDGDKVIKADHSWQTHAVLEITDEMVERAAKELERRTKSVYEWTDEQFEIWWNHDPYFVERQNGWGFFRGTQKEKLLWEVRIVLEAAHAGPC